MLLATDASQHHPLRSSVTDKKGILNQCVFDIKMKDLGEENINKNALESILHNMRMKGSISSSSLDSKDSNKTSKVPSQIDSTEKKWFTCSAQCDVEQLKRLLEKDCELINKKDYFTGFAAIHWAAKNGRCDVVSLLVEYDVDINLRTNGGYTALHIATMHSKEAIIQKLISSCDADINLRDYSGRKARHYASNELSLSVNRALQETPSLIEMNVDPSSQVVSTNGFVTLTPVPSIRRHSSMIANSHDRPSFSEESSFKKKKKGLSISNSFKMRKKSVIKRELRSDLTPIDDDIEWRRSPSVPDIVLLSQVDGKRHSVVDYSSFGPASPLDESPLRRKASVSDIVINGYAGFINENKHRKQSVVENKEWGINTWI